MTRSVCRPYLRMPPILPPVIPITPAHPRRVQWPDSFGNTAMASPIRPQLGKRMHPLTPRSRQRLARAVLPVEVLELRRMLSATLDAGVWHITGDEAGPAADVIVVEATPQDAGTLQATINGTVVGTAPVAGLTSVEVDAGAGNDRVTMGFNLPDVAVQVLGGDGNDRLTGSGGDETLIGGAGNDRLDGGGANDTLEGDDGDDQLLGGDGNDTLAGGAGRDILAGGWGDDSLDGGAGADRLQGGDGADTLAGDNGRGTLKGGPGAGSLDGGRGADRVYRQAGVDTMAGKAGRHGTMADASDRVRDDTSMPPAERQATDEQLRHWLIDAAVKQWAWAFGRPVQPWDYVYGRGGEVLVGTATGANGSVAIPTPGTGPTPTPTPSPSPTPTPGENAGGASTPPSTPTSVGTDTGGTGNNVSTTNVQVEGVDEADLVETDGKYIYSLQGDELVIVSAAPADQMKVVSRTKFDGDPLGIYLEGSRVTVLTGQYAYHILPLDPIALPGGGSGVIAPIGKSATESDTTSAIAIVPPIERTKSKVTVTVLDVADPAAPQQVEQTSLDGL